MSESRRLAVPQWRMLYNIQALRGLAALAVVFVHIADVQLAGQIPAAGRGGVDLFFVISGLIMVHIDRVRPVPAATFLIQRFARVAPLYWTMTFVVFGMAAVAPHLLESTTASVPDLLRSLLFVPYVKANGLTQPMLFVGWTLNYEMAFYVLFGLGLALPNRRAGLALTGAIILLLVLAGRLVTVRTPLLAFYTSPMLLEFLAGMGLGIVLRRRPKRPITITSSGRAVLAVAAAAAMTVLLIGPLVVSLPEPVICGTPAVILVACALRLEQSGWRLTDQGIQGLGDASYSIYLTHPFVVEAVQHLAGQGASSEVAKALLLAGTLAMVIAAGWFCHRLFERPLSRWTLDMLTRARDSGHPRLGRAQT